MTWLAGLLAGPYRWLAALGVVVLLVGGVYAYGHHRGAAAVQARWDADTAARERAVADQIAAAAALHAKQLETANEVQHVVELQRDAAIARGDDLAHHLVDALRVRNPAPVHGGPVPRAPDAAPGVACAAPESRDFGAIEAATREHLEACELDAVELRGWLDYWAALGRRP